LATAQFSMPGVTERVGGSVIEALSGLYFDVAMTSPEYMLPALLRLVPPEQVQGFTPPGRWGDSIGGRPASGVLLPIHSPVRELTGYRSRNAEAEASSARSCTRAAARMTCPTLGS
jgi:hypothetical protein